MATVAPVGVAEAAAVDLFFSQYVEGSSFNKAIEIHNGTGVDVDLAAGGYSVALYSNGSASASSTLNLTGTLANGDVWVGANGSANATVLAVADATNSSVFNWNGDDAFALLKNGVLIDVIGQIGTDPGSAWQGSGVSTLNQTLLRKDSICAGDPVGNDAFDPSVEWTGLAQDDFTGLGSHTASCDGPAQLAASDPSDEDFNAGFEIDPIALSATGGTPPYTFGVSELPAGLTFDGTAITGTPSEPGTTVVTITVTDSADPAGVDTEDFTITVHAPPPVTPIGTVQGPGDETPLDGDVVQVQGVVVGDYEGPGTPTLRGFYLQSATPDADPSTSEGIFVFNNTLPTTDDVALGDLVSVVGRAGENQGQTQLTAFDIRVDTTGQAVAPTPIALPWADAASSEAFEGMFVTVPQPMYVTEYFQTARFGEVVTSSVDHLPQPTAVVEPGPDAIDMQADNDLTKLVLDDGINNQNPAQLAMYVNGSPISASNPLRGGDTITDATGVLTYTWAGNSASGNKWRLRPTTTDALPAFDFTTTNPRPTSPPDVGGSLKIVGFNVLNFFTTLDAGGAAEDCGPIGFPQECRGADSAEEYTRQLTKLTAALVDIDADVYGLAELENSEGVDPTAPIVDALNAVHGAGTWAAVPTGVIGTDVIRVGLIYRTDKVSIAGTPAVLDSSVDPTFDDNLHRPSLAVSLEEISTGEQMTVVMNHWKSKGSCPDPAADPANADAGDGAACWNAAREAAATAVVGWLDTHPTGVIDDDYLIFGDLNSYAQEDPIDVLRAAGYVDLVQQFDPGDYSFAFDGQWGTLDYAFASDSLTAQVTGAADYHINSDEMPLLDYNTDFQTPAQQDLWYAPDQFRTSDHDPAVVGVALDSVAPTVTVEQAAGQPDPAALLSDVQFAVIFSEPVTGFGPEDLAYNDASGGRVTAVISGSGADYTVTFQRVRRLGPITLSVVAGAATDAAGNTSEASTSTDNSVTVVPPGIARN